METSKKIKFACAPIAWTNDDMPELGKENTFEQCVSEMALAGYSGTEIGNKYPRDPGTLKRYLELRNLQVASAWFSSFLTTKPFEETKQAFIEHRDFLHAMGAKVIVVAEQGRSIQGQMDTPVFKDKPVFTDAEWDLLTHGLEALGELAHEKGMEIVYHHHMGTGVQTTEEIERLMEHTAADHVSLLFDTGHLVFSGENPLAIFNKYQSRIKHIHFKDIREEMAKEVKEQNDSFLTGVKKGVFTVPGDGMIDFHPIMDAIVESGYEGWIVVEAEQDPAKANPFEYALKARKYIDELLLNKELVN
ncbi:myo-inosose-2 dehydratase [Neobacillus vireti]|uniref:Inosose dehydratase n=1 Tax=Neobacillus vireti LMG 21834 TaxID=1131730 RepID=A0AB94ISH2_9BACI|nr:myo-inosose-2 dehydratase [Neobacillus vireti]ETI69918.1 Inosose dehydratase [Neobacillus vireti LMG 21834]KLT17990.1 inosose dehydratase [Neobacillus vireti]